MPFGRCRRIENKYVDVLRLRFYNLESVTWELVPVTLDHLFVGGEEKGPICQESTEEVSEVDITGIILSLGQRVSRLVDLLHRNLFEGRVFGKRVKNERSPLKRFCNQK